MRPATVYQFFSNAFKAVQVPKKYRIELTSSTDECTNVEVSFDFNKRQCPEIYDQILSIIENRGLLLENIEYYDRTTVFMIGFVHRK